MDPSTTTVLLRLRHELHALEEKGRLRTLKLPSGIDFTSNDYLGLSRHPALRESLLQVLERSQNIGSGGSRLLRGHHPEHESLEEFAAQFFGVESALYFNSGFDANFSLFSALPSRQSAIVADELAHASIKEGTRASWAKKFTARHNDIQSFKDAILRARANGAREVFVAVESVYSMEGDQAPLGDLLSLARQQEATLIVDEAHATGIYGAGGRGLTEGLSDPCLITVHTCGKALGASGALVCASRVVKDYLINTARPFLYSTADPPIMAAVVQRALSLVEEEPWRRSRLFALARVARELMAPHAGDATPDETGPWPLLGGNTQIIPVLIGSEQAALAAAQGLQEQGFDVRPIRPPTVPEGACRLRISLNIDRTQEEIQALAEALAKVRHGP